MSPFRKLLFSFSLAVGILNSILPLAAQTSDKVSGGLDFAPLTFGEPSAANDVDVEVTAALKKIDDQTAELQVTMTLPDGYYTYSMSPDFGGGTKIKLTGLGELKEEGDWKADHEPKSVLDEALGQTVEKFFSKVTWSKTLKGSLAGDVTVSGQLTGQYCGSGENGIPGECRPIRNRKFSAKLTSATAETKPAKTETPASTDAAKAVASSSEPPESSDKNPVTLTPGIGGGKAKKTGLIEFVIGLTPKNAAVGQEVTLSIKATVKEPYHTFALDQNPEMAGVPTTIEIDTVTGLEAIGEDFIPSAEPQVETHDEFVQRVHYGEIIWTRKYVVSDPNVAITGNVRFQLCRETTCLPPTKAAFEVAMTSGSETEKPPLVTETGEPNGSEPGQVTPVAAGKSDKSLAKDGLIAFVLTAIGAGFVALLTPCVFPMIPVTVAFFLKQEEKKAGSSLKLAVVYCLSIIGAFTILGLLAAIVFGPTALNNLANNPWLNLGFAGLFLFFGIMLLGVIEIQIPYWLLSWSSSRESAGGMIGIVFMALTFTLVSFTCTFAFVGSLLVAATRGDYLWPVIGMLSFSTAFASPFFVLALFPKMLKKLPKSGGWMNDVKVVIGLVEIAAVVKFLSVSDIGFSVGQIPVYLTYDVFLWLWIAIGLIAGIYLLGFFRKPKPAFSAIRGLSALAFLLFSGRLIAGLYGAGLPADPIWNLVAAFAPPDVEVRKTEDLGYVIAHHKLDFAMEFERAVSAATKDQQPLFLDFTGVNCVNCRQMERTVMIEENVVSAMKKMVRAQLYTDLVPGITDVELREKLLLLNQELQSELTGDVALPSYAVVSADGKQVLAYFSGLDPSGGEKFLAFLNAGLERWESMKPETAKSQPQTNGPEVVLNGNLSVEN
jgi:thiol:disulfide interchange protein